MNFNKYFILFLPILWQLSTALNVIDEECKPACKSYYNTTLKKQVYTQVDKEPGFPGGAAQYQRFLFKNLKYPDVDSSNLEDLQLTIKIKFIVDTDGQIKLPAVQDKNSTGDLTALEKEMLRVITLMPKWTPGICNGRVVPVEIKQPLVVDVKLNE